jgi:hypothetical protein
MKNIFSILLSLLLTQSLLAQQGVLSGRIFDSETGEALVGTSISVSSGTATLSSIYGHYSLKLDPGIYNLHCHYVGYVSSTMTDIRIVAGDTTRLDIAMFSDAALLDEVMVLEYAVPLVEKEACFSSSTKPSTSDKKIGSLVPPPPPPPLAFEEVDIHVTRATPSRDISSAPAVSAFSDGVVRKERKRVGRTSESVLVLDEVGDEEIVSEVDEKAGQLTAGEWNDLANWDFWLDDERNSYRTGMQELWGMQMENRYTLYLTNSAYQPIVDVSAYLIAEGDTLWQARTDYEGKAELWAGVFEAEERKLQIAVTYHGETKRLKFLKTHEEGVNHLRFASVCSPSDAVDIYFAIDATGSMGDEIEYLKAEMQDVIRRVKKGNDQLDLQLGALFYWDTTDPMLCNASPLSPAIDQVTRFIKGHYAGGGGDYPEAVHTALESALNQNWRAGARARILFLVLDAPPHHTPEVLASLRESMAKAARMGVRIIPVAASGIKKDTEYLMKLFALATGGTYLFLTDDSGIGNPHLEATAEDFEVVYLNDLLVEVIGRYSREMCEAEDRWQGEDGDNPLAAVDHGIQFFPNPANDHILLTLEENANRFQITNAQGKLLKDYGPWQRGTARLDISDIPAGIYFLNFQFEDSRRVSKKLVVEKVW